MYCSETMVFNYDDGNLRDNFTISNKDKLTFLNEIKAISDANAAPVSPEELQKIYNNLSLLGLMYFNLINNNEDKIAYLKVILDEKKKQH
ncbi:2055_t:CDS:2 [Diversispora eburnea]|uniref:2055_t:CDS:1 n=1 Tax=Diversispora eburnea TaxID=1213867 RepID=A0A9N8Z3A4_9GLOM|nr:2055_t:CDS:2 [Diversispora eburnea]